MMTITKSIDEGHDNFQNYVVIPYLQEWGFLVEPGIPYHSLCPNEECQRPVVSEETKSFIRLIHDDMTIHYFRDTNDIFAIHPETLVSFFIECKNALTIEAIQFLLNYVRASATNVKIIYALRNPHSGEEKGFTIGKNMPRKLWDNLEIQYHKEQTNDNGRPIFEDIFKTVFKNKVRFTPAGKKLPGKSSDPFIWVSSLFDEMQDWRSEVKYVYLERVK